MKNLVLIFIAFIILTACKKDKAPVTVVDSSCTQSISFANQILPMIQTYCISCHDYGNSTGYTLVDHSSVSTNASAVYNSLLGANVELMPQGGPALNDSLIKQFSCWINQGKQNN